MQFCNCPSLYIVCFKTFHLKIIWQRDKLLSVFHSIVSIEKPQNVDPKQHWKSCQIFSFINPFDLLSMLEMLMTFQFQVNDDCRELPTSPPLASKTDLDKIFTDGTVTFNSYISRKVDDFTHCCAAQAAKADVLCDIRHQDGLSNCGGLLKYTVLKYFIWILGILSFLGNLGVILWR